MALAGNGNTYLMVLGTPTGDEVTVNLSARLLREGGALGPEIPVRSLADAFGAGAIATTHEYFVRYFEGATGKLIPVGRAGRVGEPLDLPGSSTSIAAATGPDHTLVTWAGTSSILARRFARGDFRGDVIVVAESTGIPAVAWDGDRYWVVWSSEPELGHALARPVSARGVLGDTVTLVEDECNGPSVASNGNGQLLLACYKFSEQFRLVRVTTRLVDTTQNDFDL
jgi:hypothetical protein